VRKGANASHVAALYVCMYMYVCIYDMMKQRKREQRESQSHHSNIMLYYTHSLTHSLIHSYAHTITYIHVYILIKPAMAA